MTTLEDDLNELAVTISKAIEKARQLKLPTSAYILSMVLVEVWEAAKAAEDNVTDNAAHWGFFAHDQGNSWRNEKLHAAKELASIDPDDPAFFDRERQPAMFQG